MIAKPATDPFTGEYFPQPWSVPTGGEPFTSDENPNDLSEPLALPISRFSNMLDLGILPCGGDQLSQPAKLMEGLRLWKKAIEACYDVLPSNQGGRNGDE